jgi:hypothetical protein
MSALSFMTDEARNGRAPWVNAGASGWCTSSYIGVHVTLDYGEIINGFRTTMTHFPLIVRASRATAERWRAIEDKARQDEIERSKVRRPTL